MGPKLYFENILVVIVIITTVIFWLWLTINEISFCPLCENDDADDDILTSEEWRWRIGDDMIWWHDNRFEVNWPPEPTLVLRWISKFFLFGALPSDTLKIKHTKKLKEIPSRHVLENLPEKACMNAFIHLKLISNVQGFN